MKYSEVIQGKVFAHEDQMYIKSGGVKCVGLTGAMAGQEMAFLAEQSIYVLDTAKITVKNEVEIGI